MSTNALEDMLGPGCVVCGYEAGHAPWCTVEEAHPVPHPGCTACDPAFMRSRLAHLGFPRRVRREVQLVAIEPGGPVVAVFGKGER